MTAKEGGRGLALPLVLWYGLSQALLFLTLSIPEVLNLCRFVLRKDHEYKVR